MRLIWSPEARRDKDDIWIFLADRSVGRADAVEALIERRAERLTRFPMLGRSVRGPMLRELSVPDAQYVLVYRIEDDAIRIMRVWSTRQNREDA